MTAQVSDKVIYNDERYSLVGISGNALFEPQEIGLQPRWFTSLCFRGFNCTYALKEHALVLERLFISLSPEQMPPLLHGVEPQEHEPPPKPQGGSVILARPNPELLRERAGLVVETDNEDDQSRKKRRKRKPPRRYIYEDVNLPMDFTGGLLLGRDFIEELYVHMGFHPAWKYREVHELLFENGVLQSYKDCSQDMSWVRLNLAGKDRPTSNSDDDVKRWISDCFSLKYTR